MAVPVRFDLYHETRIFQAPQSGGHKRTSHIKLIKSVIVAEYDLNTVHFMSLRGLTRSQPISMWIEINPRIGAGLWRRIEAGINKPLMILKIARGEEVEPIREYPVGLVFVDPVEHSVLLGLALVDLLIYRFRT